MKKKHSLAIANQWMLYHKHMFQFRWQKPQWESSIDLMHAQLWLEKSKSFVWLQNFKHCHAEKCC